MPHVHVFITSDLGCEVGLTALARFLLPKDVVATANVRMSEIRDPGILLATLQRLQVEPLTLNLCGDFWGAEAIQKIRDLHPSVSVYTFTFDGSVVLVTPASVKPKTECTPTGFITGRAIEVLGEGPLIRFALSQNAAALRLLDDRCRGVNVGETQPFFAGLCNVQLGADGPLDLEDRIFRLLSGEITLGEVLKIGASVVRSQIEVARERALKNARKGTLKSGEPYVVTEGPEFVNLTHDELHTKYPEVRVTVVASLKFTDGKPDVVAHSMRAWSPDVDVKQLVGAHGGGSANAAGARRELDIHIDY